MASTAAPSAAVHRSISNIRTGGSHSPSHSGPTSPHTPLRTSSSVYGSPSSLRADEDTIIVEFGARKLRVGFAGDFAPKGTVEFGPEGQRRVGDFRVWQVGYQDDWRKRVGWGRDCELWQPDVRNLDLGLVGDRIERGLREVFTKYLLIDSRPRKAVLVLPSAVPLPLLSTILDTMFTRFQNPYISLLSAPVMCAAAAGVRSTLIVDLGWAETVVTSVYEYREVGCSRSIRAGKMMVQQVHKLLAQALDDARGRSTGSSSAASEERVVSFQECEDVAIRLLWCQQKAKAAAAPSESHSPDPGLPTVTETDESDVPSRPPESTTIPLRSTSPPTTISLPYSDLASPAESTFFSPPQLAPATWDDHELPLPQLLFTHLLRLPVDVRAICMARLIFTGGCSGVLGLRGRIFDELEALVEERGWDPVTGRGAAALKANPKLKGRRANGTSKPHPPPQQAEPTNSGGAEVDGVWDDAAPAPAAPTTPGPPAPEPDPVEAQLARTRGARAPPPVGGRLRALDSLGAWAGASLLTQLKVPAVATVDRELWAAQGVQGAGRAGDVDLKAQQRQSMGPAGGMMRTAGGAGGQGGQGANWTLGAWGSV